MKNSTVLFGIVCSIMLSCFSSCIDTDEPAFTLTEIKKTTIPISTPGNVVNLSTTLDDGFIIKHNDNNLMSIEIRNGSFLVRSAFNNTLMPTITYLGTFTSFDDVPLKDVGTGSVSYILKDGGGFNILTEVYNPYTANSQKIIVKLFMTYTSVSGSEGLNITYQVCPIGSSSFNLEDMGEKLVNLEVDGNYIEANSILSTVSSQPLISYMGRFGTLDQIPVWADTPGYKRVELVDNGGYLLKFKKYDASIRDDKVITIKLYARFNTNISGKVESITFQYQFIYFNIAPNYI